MVETTAGKDPFRIRGRQVRRARTLNPTMRTRTKVPRSREDADPAIAPELVGRVLQKAAELHADELTQVRRSELFEAAAQAGIPARYVSAALQQVAPAPVPAKAPAAAAPAPAAGSSDTA